MAVKIQVVRGMHDILPNQIRLWQYVEKLVRQVMDGYGYQEIRLPIVEATELFKRSIGEITDIVAKEMYSFTDRNGDSLTLRPEGTAGCVRAVIENGLLDSPHRLWYQGPMFRHERPQKGRYRQFHQVGVEVFGLPGPDVDLEVILLTARLWQCLGVGDLNLQINTLGTPEERVSYRTMLVSYFHDHYTELDDDSRRRLEQNPLRILDSKNLDLQKLIMAAPTLAEHIGCESQEHFEYVCTGLKECGIPYSVNRHLVRGLDYYTRTVFEWVSDKLGSQGTVCAGGRYDGLVTILGGPITPAIGCAVGLERLLALLEPTHKDDTRKLDLYVITMGEQAQRRGQVLAYKLHDELPYLRVQVHSGGGTVKNQFKKADRSGALYALIIGDEELAHEVVSLKCLRNDGVQNVIPLNKLTETLTNYFANT